MKYQNQNQVLIQYGMWYIYFIHKNVELFFFKPRLNKDKNRILLWFSAYAPFLMNAICRFEKNCGEIAANFNRQLTTSQCHNYNNIPETVLTQQKCLDEFSCVI